MLNVCSVYTNYTNLLDDCLDKTNNIEKSTVV